MSCECSLIAYQLHTTFAPMHSEHFGPPTSASSRFHTAYRFLRVIILLPSIQSYYAFQHVHCMAGERWSSWLKKLKSGKHSLRRGLKSSTSTSTAEVNTILEDSFEEDDSFWCTFAYRHCWLMWTSSKAWTMHASESRRQRQLASYILNSFLKRKVHGACKKWHMAHGTTWRHFPDTTYLHCKQADEII